MTRTKQPVLERGFTLIEVLVALVIAALLTAILLGGAATARRRVVLAEQQRKAVFLARTLLAEAVAEPFAAEPTKGTTNGLAWTVRASIIQPDPRGRIGLVEFIAAVTDAKGKPLFTGQTRRLKIVQPS